MDCRAELRINNSVVMYCKARLPSNRFVISWAGGSTSLITVKAKVVVYVPVAPEELIYSTSEV